MPETVARQSLNEKFPVQRAREIIKSILKEKLSEVAYEAENTPTWTREISDLVKNRLKELQTPRYKLMVNTIIVEQRDQGVRIGTRCFWDETTDFMIPETFKKNAPLNAHVTPIFQTSTFFFDDCDQGRDTFQKKNDNKFYSRISNPTVEAFEQCVHELERGRASTAYSSGMSAIFSSISPYLKSGDHCLCINSGYGSSLSIFRDYFSRFQVDTTFFDPTQSDDIHSLLKSNTKIPTNPVNRIADLPAIAECCHSFNPSIRVIVDSTLASPLFFKPLLHGADIVVHSATKFINGHSDVIAGIATVRTAQDRTLVAVVPQVSLHAQTRCYAARLPDIVRRLSGQDAFLCLRGLRTLPLRMVRCFENCELIASYLERHPKVKRVHYIGLASHPQFDAAKSFLHGLQLITIAVSLGMTDTVAEHPASMTHNAVPEHLLAEQDLTPGLIRMSVGLEDADDLVDDISQSLEKL